MKHKRKALFSLHLLDEVEKFARGLVALGWEIIATRETCEILSKAAIPVTSVEAFTGQGTEYSFPPTLHPKVEEYLTSNDGHRIDLVYIVPYPLTMGNDIGGRTLLALAAKGNRTPVMSPSDMNAVMMEMRERGDISRSLHRALIDKALASIVRHYAQLLSKESSYDAIVGDLQYELLNGENPYQIPASLFSSGDSDELSLPKFVKVSGEMPCFTNLADADAILHTMCLAAEAFRRCYGQIPYIAVASKHGNACGMAVSWHDQSDAVLSALFGNPKSIWGGEFICNFAIDKSLAELLLKNDEREKMLSSAAWMLDVIMAPDFTQEAVEILGKRPRRKLLKNRALSSPVLPPRHWAYRHVRGGFLRHPLNNYVLDIEQVVHAVTEMENEDIDSRIIAWATAWSSSHGGNEITLSRGRKLLGAGGGPSTIEAAELAVMRATSCGHDLNDGIFAANAFFPFIDAPKVLAQAGLGIGLVPAGGKREQMVRSFFEEQGVRMIYLPEQNRGFSRH